ncbi:uncharacterized protein LOC110882558 [Helianthus annuus]|uniref:uncharacterized protein LOC110882558 n=1 Tax=Helianthus annuus TaxID=4232 RepID=UPI000B90079A|nr:uncharacterized protein LOC110882558 [Helianthus annuus]
MVSIALKLLFPRKKTIPGVWKDIISVESDLAKVGISIKEYLVKEGVVWKWRNDLNGAFSVKQVRLDIEEACSDGVIGSPAFGWNNWAPLKANYLLWRAMIGKIASKLGLICRGIPLGDSLCPRCGLIDEDPDHIFVNCLWAQCIWCNILVWVRVGFPDGINSLKDLIFYIKNRPGGAMWKRIGYTIAIATVWKIWNARNVKVFKDSFIPISKTVDQIKEDAFRWISNRSKLKPPLWENWKAFDILALL